MLTAEEAKKIGLRACIDKIGYEFCKKHEDTAVCAYGEDNGVMECYVGVDDQPDDFDAETSPLILDDTRLSPYYARCHVSLSDEEISFLDFRLPENA